VEEDVRGVSPETIAVGVFSIVGTLLGVVAGLFGERWVRSWGDVRCEIPNWSITVGNPAEPEESQVEVRFLNEKELPVVVWEVGVEFYKGEEPLEAWAHPTAVFLDEATGIRSPVAPVNLPPRVAVMRTLILVSGREDKRQELARADRAVFVANMSGAPDIREELTPPW
jgi:hypothetical protein